MWPRLVVRGYVGAIVVGMTVMASRVALAQSPSAQAQGHQRAGMAYAERDKWEEAVREFEEAYALDPQLKTLFNVAQSRLRAKRYRGAAEAYRRLLATRSSLSTVQQASADEGLATSLAHVAHLEISGAQAGDIVEVDGLQVDTTRAIDVDVDPGEHRIVLLRGSTRLREKHVKVDDGQRVRVSLRGGAETVPPVASAVPAAGAERADAGTDPPPLAAPPTEAAAADRRPVAGYVLGGIGVAALGVGGVLGIATLSRRSELDDRCGASHSCAKSEVDAVRARMAVADVTVGVGVLAVAIGAYLILTRPSAPVSIAAAAAPGGGYAELRARF